MTDDTTWLTPDAHKRLTDELRQLETEGRAAAADRLAEARSHGDIRENADYEAAKDEQGLLEARIRRIRRLLEQAEISTPEATERVEIGTVVTLTDQDGSEIELFVAPTENKAPGYVLASPTSPIGRAVLGAEVGEVVSYEAPGGTFEVTVRGVRPFNG